MQEAEVSFTVNGKVVNLSVEDQEYFWSRICKKEGCWIWPGPFNRGYGSFERNKQKMLAHRVAFVIVNRELPQELLVCHRCDNPPCCNPDHLFLGSHADNKKDSVSKGRHGWATGDKHWTRLGKYEVPKGETHCCATLTEKDVRTIRERHATEHVPQNQLAREYKISANQINRIVRRLAWAHVV